MYISSINHYIFEVSRYTNIVYVGKYLVPTYIMKGLFVTKLYLLVSKLYELVRKFHNFFLTSSETEAWFIFEGFMYCLLWKVYFQLSGTFFAFFIWSVNCSRDFFSQFVRHWIIWVEYLSHVTYLWDVQKLKH